MSKRQERIKFEESRRKKVKVKKKNPLVFLLIVFIIGYFSFNILRQEYNILQLNRKKAQLEADLNEENIKTNELKEELDQSDTKSYIEYLAKKYLGLIYPDEKVYVPVENGKEEDE